MFWLKDGTCLTVALSDTEENDDRAAARPITPFDYRFTTFESNFINGQFDVRGTWLGDISTVDDVDWFDLGFLPAGEIIEIGIDGTVDEGRTLLPNFEIVDEAGEQLFVLSNGGSLTILFGLPRQVDRAGHYYLRVSGVPPLGETVSSTGLYELFYTRFGVSFPRVREALVDGVEELFFANSASTTGTFSVMGDSYPALVDWDGDLDLDLFVAGSNAVLRVFENRGNPVLANWSEVTSQFNGLSSAWSNRVRPAPSGGGF